MQSLEEKVHTAPPYSHKSRGCCPSAATRATGAGSSVGRPCCLLHHTPHSRGWAQVSMGATLAPFLPASPQVTWHPARPLCGSLYPFFILPDWPSFPRYVSSRDLGVSETYNMERDASPALPPLPSYLSQVALSPFHVKVASGTEPEGNKDYNYISQLGKEES